MLDLQTRKVKVKILTPFDAAHIPSLPPQIGLGKDIQNFTLLERELG